VTSGFRNGSDQGAGAGDAKKAKEVVIFTCKVCTGKYTDARGSGGDGKKNFGFCSKRAGTPKPKAPKPKCEHKRDKCQCMDCGTGNCELGRRKGTCRDCGTGHCEHGRPEARGKDCGTGHCQHGRRRGLVWRDYSTVHRQHDGRQKQQCIGSYKD
jgi:hypothetical protein